MCKVRTFWAITIQENVISLVLPLLILCLEGRLRPVQTCFLYAFFSKKTIQPFILALNRLCFSDLRLNGLRIKPFIYMHLFMTFSAALGIVRSNKFVGLCARLAQTFITIHLFEHHYPQDSFHFQQDIFCYPQENFS